MLQKYRGQRQHFAIVKSGTEAAERAQQLGSMGIISTMCVNIPQISPEEQEYVERT